MQIVTDISFGFFLLYEGHAWVVAIYAFIIGAISASFGGVLVHRLPHQMKWIEDPIPNYTILAPRSHCESCKVTLGVTDLIPIIGWLKAGGKCACCSANIPMRYPLTEFAMGFVFAALILLVPDLSQAMALMLLIWTGYIIFCLDMKHHWIPAVITTPLLWIGILYSPFEPDMNMRVWGAIIGGSMFLVTFMIVQPFKDEEIYSGGDVAYAAVAGAWLGAFDTPTFVFVSSVFFCVHCLFNRGSRWLPFGPTLILGLITTIALPSLH